MSEVNVGPDTDESFFEVADRLKLARDEIGRIVIGQSVIVDHLMVALLGGGHVLVEGAPGLGKTLVVRTLGAVFGLATARIQFTPDLMPADITGTNVLIHDERGGFHSRFEPGPVFAQMVLADEINRATPKTQSALLEAMQERTVTVAGMERPLPRPFFVMATQNPIELEGTYVLPEAQIDRFFLKLIVRSPSEDVLDEVLRVTTGEPGAAPRSLLTSNEVIQIQEMARSISVASHVRRSVARFIVQTHPDQTKHAFIRDKVRYGVSPRGAQAWLAASKAWALLDGRYAVDYSDLRSMLPATLRHRLKTRFNASDEGHQPDSILEELYAREIAPLE